MNDPRKKRSCARCRQSKRRCDGDGEDPCSNCVRRKLHCDYSQKDRRSQRSSIGYVKSLETNNEVYESTLALLVSLRDNPELLKEKLDSLVTSFPSHETKDSMERYSKELDDEIQPNHSNSNNEHAIIDQDFHYFGPGSIYHFQNFTRPDTEPLVRPDSFHAITLEEDYDYVAQIVRDFFDQQYPNVFLYMLDRDTVLSELEQRNLDGSFLCKELVYAICANCEKLLYEEADAYRNLVSRLIFMDNLSSSVAIAQAYVLLAIHDISKGQISNGWLLSGLGFRCGTDLGFDMNRSGELCPKTNRFFMASIIIDCYMSLSVGRRTSLSLSNVPILRLPGESDIDYLSLKYCVELVEMTRGMIRSTYQPVMFDKDPKINYLMKFNRSKAFNVKLLKWKAGLDPRCHWQHASMKSSKNLAYENHAVKYLFYYLILFLNKPFLHVPKQHSTVYIIEQISREMYLIVCQQLERLQAEVDTDSESSPHLTVMAPFTENDSYHWAAMDICMLTLLSHVLVTLITSQPEHYMYLEKHFKAFARYLNIASPRKYKAKDNPIQKLYTRFVNFKSQVRLTEGIPEPPAQAYEMNQLREAIVVEGDDVPDLQSAHSDSSSGRRARHSETSMLSEDYTSLKIADQGVMKQAGSQNLNTSFGSALNPKAPEEIFIPMPVKVEETQGAQLGGMPVMPQQGNFGFDAHKGQPTMGQPTMDYYQQFPPYADSTSGVFPYAQSAHQVQPIPTAQFGAPQPYYNYDQLPPVQDPVGSMMNSLFSNTGQEFATERQMFNWDALFKDQYVRMN